MGHAFLPDRPVNEAQSLQVLSQGGVPLRAQRRIHELNAGGQKIFTSTLTTSETVVARATGLTAISQVMGSSVFHVGFKGYTSWSGGELEPLTRAYDRARSLALSRMQQEAQLLGAHMVVDVRFLGKGYTWAEDLIEFTAVGTAVRIDGQPPNLGLRAPHGSALPPQTPGPQLPVLTLLEADELYKLHNAGYWPVGIAIGNCFFYARHADCVGEGSFFSQELPVHTQASQTARDLAVQRFRAFAAHFGAHGVVGVKMYRHAREQEWESNERKHTSFSIDMVVTGTCVVRRGDAKPPPRPRLVVDARDRDNRYGKHG
jgi:uncharacterized protein YbjQ (UPF0145 family)